MLPYIWWTHYTLHQVSEYRCDINYPRVGTYDFLVKTFLKIFLLLFIITDEARARAKRKYGCRCRDSSHLVLQRSKKNWGKKMNGSPGFANANQMLEKEKKEKTNQTKPQPVHTLALSCSSSGAHSPLLWHRQPPSAPVPRRLVNDLRAREVRTHYRHAWAEQSAPPPPGRVRGREYRRHHARAATKDHCLQRRAASGEWCLGSIPTIPTIPSIGSIGSSDESS